MELDWQEVIREIRVSPEDSTIYIGSDSKVYSKRGQQMVAYVTVVIVHYGTSKGAKLFKSYRTDRYYGQIRQRLMAEVQDVIEAGSIIVDHIGPRAFEIHLDINRGKEHKSSEIVKEATGYVLGMFGFEPKLKPDSFAASSVADRFCVTRAKSASDSPGQKRKYRKLRKVA